MPPFFALTPPGDTGRLHANGPLLTGETINLYGLAEVSPQDAPDTIRSSDFAQRPARVQNTVRFSPGGACGSWCRDSFRGQRMRGMARTATPRGGMTPDRQRTNIHRPASTTFGQLVERVLHPYHIEG